MIWKPNVTVAAVIEENHRFLMVREQIVGEIKLNQPAGHLEPNESVIDAVIREVREETRYDFEPKSLIGVYLINSQTAHGVVCYLRFAFAGQLLRHDATLPLEKGIIEAPWLSYEEIKASKATHRSTLVQECIDDYCKGQRFSLDILHHDASITELPLSLLK